MKGTMTYTGLDVHARSTHACAIEVETGEVRRARFGLGSEEVIAWLQGLPQPLEACYEAGPTGFALRRAAERAGVQIEVDSRPSDAIALAVRAEAPIFADDRVIEESAIEFEGEEVNEEEIVDEFRKFLDHVTPDEFAVEEDEG